jgi:hypothetical protein
MSDQKDETANESKKSKQGNAWQINSEPRDTPDRGEDLHSRSDDGDHGNAWQINENTEGDD